MFMILKTKFASGKSFIAQNNKNEEIRFKISSHELPRFICYDDIV